MSLTTPDPNPGPLLRPAPARSLRRRALLAGLAAAGPLLLGCAAAPAVAQAPLVELRLVDRDTGSVLPTWRHAGQVWAAGRPGARYAIRVTNRSGARVLAVVSVDGVNVVTGETAAWNQGGYVLDPGRSADLTGWRKSMSEVAAFEFAALGDSYAARTGRPDHVGVIGVAAFRERVDEPPLAAAAPPLPRPSAAREAAGAAAPAPNADAQPGSSEAWGRAESARAAPSRPAPAERLGTAHGAREGSLTRYTTFERASSAPEQVAQIRYDSRENLVAAGVIPMPRPLRPQPQPFPDSPLAGFVPDPPR
jgi:hypothetical protein